MATPPTTTADDRGELDAGAGGGVERAVARGVEHARQAGDRAAGDERAEHAAAHADAGEHARRRGWSRSRTARGPCARGASTAPTMSIATIVNSGSTGKPRIVSRAEVQEAVGHVGGVDLAAVRPREVDAADHVERAERDHQRRHPRRTRPSRRCISPKNAPNSIPATNTSGIGDAVVGEQHAGREGGDAEHRADREVDVAGDDDDRLADREQRDDRDVEQDVAQVLRVEEARLGDA